MISCYEVSIDPNASAEEFKCKKHHQDTLTFWKRLSGDVKGS